jgi:hypothetical protein
MSIKEDFDSLLNKLQNERDEIILKLHLATMEAKQEFEEAEDQWQHLKVKAAEISDESVQTKDEVIAKAKIVAEELKDTYYRIGRRLS